MHIKVLQGDITKLHVDAIVNAANSSLLGGGGVDGAIHRAAGKELLEECRELHGCKTGQCKMTKGYNLPAKYVIHTVGPVWNGGTDGEAELLSCCYRNSIQCAIEHECKSIAFPAISTGIYGYPKEQAAEIAISTIIDSTKGQADSDFEVWLVAFDEETERLYHNAMLQYSESLKS
ncbi:O-acetyl-ADP-ribose deacetylase [Hespellia stercorisuis]|uniref:O-acetyl-ADP-ribose deacetylase (Regulator of RNase III), contains Macro domain n=1 Tax=Hespellia stercorisuis DSM 15480 TaxID=1121950 RepID=A0A1M6V9V9_9FIRM|nr:O-acetyl-ADP-ribose deacetylase [Hespellia stercorisuis]SHK78293.1 O-acetyl-ADP-ribose deacetylase (regulator of RNase III), contains Macro domain [Hespellia stercorisuis DSM 15480]